MTANPTQRTADDCFLSRAQRRFAAFGRRWPGFCRVHETLRATPAMALGLVDRPLSIGDLLDAALQVVPRTADPPTQRSAVAS